MSIIVSPYSALRPKLNARQRKPRYSLSRLRSDNHWSVRGLVGCWLCNEGGGNTIFDLSGKNHGTFIGAPTWTAGKFGPALSFDASDDGVSIPSNILSGTTDCTLSAWINCASGVNIFQAIHKRNGGYQGAFQFGLAHWGEVNWSIYNGGYQFLLQPAGVYYDDGLWHHIVGTRIGLSGHLYVDGVLVDSDTGASVLSIDGSLSTAIGRDIRDGFTCDGFIDNALIYNRALTDIEVTELYRNPFLMVAEQDLAWLYEAAVGAVSPTGVFYGPLVGPLGGPV